MYVFNRFLKEPCSLVSVVELKGCDLLFSLILDSGRLALASSSVDSTASCCLVFSPEELSEIRL